MATDSPISYGMSLDKLKDYIKELDGQRGLEKGTSSLVHDSVDDVILCNRAGPGERTLTKTEMIEKFCNHRSEQ